MMKDRATITPDVLKELLECDTETGVLHWKKRPDRFFKSAKAARAWNLIYEGMPALSTKTKFGYVWGNILGNIFWAHRVIWAIHYGKWPDGELDHINHDRADNRISNLKDGSRLDNTKNRSMAKNNTSEVMGVAWNKQSEAWCARIGVNYKQVHLGLFASIDDAIEARKAAEVKYGFHPNHGTDAPPSTTDNMDG